VWRDADLRQQRDTARTFAGEYQRQSHLSGNDK
jgi:hypothetical protein